MNPENVMQWFDEIYLFVAQGIEWVLHNPDAKLLKSLIILTFFLTLRNIIKKFIVANLEILVLRKHPNIQKELIKELEEPIKYLPLMLGIYFSFLSYTPDSIALLKFQQNVFSTLWIFSSFWVLYNVVNPFAMILNNYSNKFKTPVVVWVIKLFRIILVIVGFALILEIWGVQIGPIIAGLGLFGMAVALGARDLFKNILAGITIISESRFSVGNRIKIEKAEVEGVVEHIGFRSTAIRKYDQSLIYIPNSELADFALINFSEREFLRINWNLQLQYQTTNQQLKYITNEIELYLLKNPNISKERGIYAKVSEFKESSIDIMVICFTTDKWVQYLQVKEDLVLTFKSIVEECGASFAFPSQSLYIEKNLDYKSKQKKLSDAKFKASFKKLQKERKIVEEEKNKNEWK